MSEVLDEQTVDQIVDFLDERIESTLEGKAFEANIREFVNRRLDELVNSQTPLGDMFTPDAIGLLKEKAGEQIEPAVHQLSEIAAAQKPATR